MVRKPHFVSPKQAQIGLLVILGLMAGIDIGSETLSRGLSKTSVLCIYAHLLSYMFRTSGIMPRRNFRSSNSLEHGDNHPEAVRRPSRLQFLKVLLELVGMVRRQKNGA
jgi:hypothetical protein